MREHTYSGAHSGGFWALVMWKLRTPLAPFDVQGCLAVCTAAMNDTWVGLLLALGIAVLVLSLVAPYLR